ncbi:lanosterol 14-alpha demethylase [Basidiobolus meristosporus CBS 931.73]|uniref:Lanosterol 14-alpha demethylase n=1 Tax=Basidiobolus meristosporus CBS 931.73 TaxID=1314790 RepID=A0A1Y1X8F8_9FUNG|nr:lanosterol 14-alpha demethylase [Basidiobolus meristosporus CBS 931.73]|eukprot:ORX82040.1 lanosterol 14-alpha demethylase [Basidiobolus meristosporus CBS 931.73]
MGAIVNLLQSCFTAQAFVNLATIAFGTLVVYVLNDWYNQKFGKKDPNAPPMVPYWIPFIGSMIDFGTNPVEFLTENRKKYGDVFTFLMFGRKMTYALGTEGNNFVLNAKHSHVNAEDAYRPLTKPVFGEGVVYDCPNHRLMDQKRFAKEGLSFDALRTYVPIIVEETTEYFKRWNKKTGEAEVSVAFAELIINTASRCLMGKEIRSQLDETVAHLIHDLDNGFQPINFLFERLPLPSYRKRDEAHIKLTNVFLNIINNRRRNNDMDNQDILQHFMTATYKDGHQMSDTEVAHMMIALLMAGQHTSAATSTWALMRIAHDPEIRSQVYAEQKAIFGDDLKPLNFNDLNKCKVLDNLVRETLRMHTPIVAIMRKVVKPVNYPESDIVVPAGHYLCASPIIAQLSEEYFENPMKFDIARWNNIAQDNEEEDEAIFGSSGKGAKNPYLPFGAGRHRCIGEPFAYVQIKTILATMVRMFEIESIPGREFPQPNYSKLFVTPETPIPCKYTRRD